MIEVQIAAEERDRVGGKLLTDAKFAVRKTTILHKSDKYLSRTLRNFTISKKPK